jgi:glucose/arabinose dehydrogenase/mono/diheme cytochrome c family protein
MKKVSYLYLLLIFTCLYCRSNKQVSAPQASAPVPVAAAAAEAKKPESPVLSPAQSLLQMQVEPGFDVKLVAAEPLLNTPVALSFDARGRMWVVEMETFMTDTTGKDENMPKGRIVILEDQNQDGQADHRQVFLDSLLMPRAICLLEQGLLVAEPPRLWYVEMKNDRPGRRTLVDEHYTEGGNVESQANGLFRALDNWIYSGGSDKRYRLQNGRWQTERTHMRGQWGISQDDHGRLYYNNNSQNLLGDYFLPGLGAANDNQKRVAGFSEKIVPDNRVYPARPTPGVNRGYKPGVLDDSARLVSFTAGCGPVVYRGDLFGSQYGGNAFVAEPAANLIKRNVLAPAGHGVQGRQAYRGREFLASTDERFRPVSLYDGPDGALYVVDMYRGIIQYKMFLTEYLKREIRQRELYRHLSYGRIYKIVPKGKTARPVILPDDLASLVPLLGHANGWVRDKAQQRLVDAQDRRVIPALQQLLRQPGQALARIHALWTLEGLGALAPADVLPLLRHPDWTLRRQALGVLPAVMTAKNYRPLVPALTHLVQSGDTLAAPYVAFAANALQPFNAAAADKLLLAVVKKYPADRYITDAVVSNLKGREAAFAGKVQALRPGAGWLLPARLKGVLADIQHARSNRDVLLLQKQFPRGAGLFRSTCQPCHGADGNGVRSLAPPLNHSEWVTGDKDKLSAIVLFGLTGPVKVNGTLYQSPEISGDMPGIGHNIDVVNEDIAQLLSFIRNSWSNTADQVTDADIVRVRQKYKGRQKAFTAEELSQPN